MPEAISLTDWQALPREAQREVKDFFLFIQAKYTQQAKLPETTYLSESTLAKDWLRDEEEEAWKEFQ